MSEHLGDKEPPGRIMRSSESRIQAPQIHLLGKVLSHAAACAAASRGTKINSYKIISESLNLQRYEAMKISAQRVLPLDSSLLSPAQVGAKFKDPDRWRTWNGSRADEIKDRDFRALWSTSLRRKNRESICHVGGKMEKRGSAVFFTTKPSACMYVSWAKNLGWMFFSCLPRG